MTNKAALLRSVSALATAAASTAGGVQQASAQVLTPGPGGYYYSVTGGLMFSPSERALLALEDKVGFSGSGESFGTSSYYSSSGTGSSYSSFTYWSSYTSSYTSGLDDFAGIFGSVSFGKQLDPNWDIRGTLSVTNGGSTSGFAEIWGWNSSFTFFSSNYGDGSGSGYVGYSSSYSYDDAWAAGTYKFGFAAADFEVGYTPVLSDTFNVRLFAGLRALKFKSSFEGENGGSGYDYYSSYTDYFPNSAYYSYSSYDWYRYSFSGLTEVEFTGIGPRVGAQVATRFEGTNFGLSGSVAAAVLFGDEKVSWSGSSYYSSYSEWSSYTSSSSNSGSSAYESSGPNTGSYSSSKTVLDLQASIGVDYYLNDSTALTVGYQAEKLMEIDGEDMGPGTKIDVLTHGPFVRLGGTF